jgi:hypothetical protein
MNAPEGATRECLNEGCFRPAEPGEAYCDACGLERCLFDRDARASRIEADERRG